MLAALGSRSSSRSAEKKTPPRTQKCPPRGLVIPPAKISTANRAQPFRHSGAQSPQSAIVKAPSILVAPTTAVQVVDHQLATAVDVIIRDHDAGNRPQQAGIADQPAENVRTECAEQLPPHHEDAAAATDQTSCT